MTLRAAGVATLGILASTALHAAAAPVVAEPPRIPGFASSLALQAVPAGPDAWLGTPSATVWRRVAALGTQGRQPTRWALARSLIGEARSAEALGVLDVMAQDEPDIALVPAWRLARGVALAGAGRTAAALTALGDPAFATNPEACAWRLRAGAQAGFAVQALAEARCARPAMAARTRPQRRPFILAAARGAIAAGKPADAAVWLRNLAAGDAEAQLLRGKVALAFEQSKAELERVAVTGAAEPQADARLSLVEAGLADRTLPRDKALAQLRHLRFVWRGGEIERRALDLEYRLASEAGDTRGALAAGATLTRFFEPDAETPIRVAALQALLAASVGPDSRVPVEQAAALYWDFRDLSPAGSAGDLLVSRLADRLQLAGLYGRAGELLHYQLIRRVHDIAQGPLSVKVATLAILAGFPDRAVRAIRETDGNLYPPEMIWERHRIEAVALQQLGKTDEALAALQDVPDRDRLRAEIYWKAANWQGLAATTGPALPPPGRLDGVAQTMILRHAIALAMLGREADLARLRARYGASFARLATRATFDVLTHAVGSVDPAIVSRAMADLPTVSPAGSIGDLLDVPPAAAPARASGRRRSS